MITRVVGGKALPKEIADQIIERTDGIPLFIEELTKAVIESGVVAEARRPLPSHRATHTSGYPDLAACIAAGPA